MTPRPDDREVLRTGELTVLGRIRSASNATFLCEATLDERTAHCVYKPVSGEQPAQPQNEPAAAAPSSDAVVGGSTD